jgi:hypothetical protein
MAANCAGCATACAPGATACGDCGSLMASCVSCGALSAISLDTCLGCGRSYNEDLNSLSYALTASPAHIWTTLMVASLAVGSFIVLGLVIDIAFHLL